MSTSTKNICPLIFYCALYKLIDIRNRIKIINIRQINQVQFKGFLKQVMLNISKKKIILTLLIFIISISSAYAIRSRTDYFLKPQIGLWFGPITPVYTTADDLNPDIGAGLFLRYNTPLSLLKIGIDSSYHNFKSEGVNELTAIPVYGSLIFLLPLNWPVKIQLKAGAGSSYLHMMPDDSSQWDPVFVAGAELSFPAGRIVNIGLRIDYIHFYEGNKEGYKKGGHIVNAGLSLYFNINL